MRLKAQNNFLSTSPFNIQSCVPEMTALRIFPLSDIIQTKDWKKKQNKKTSEIKFSEFLLTGITYTLTIIWNLFNVATHHFSVYMTENSMFQQILYKQNLTALFS